MNSVLAAIATTVVGGLGIFLIGMKFMSDGLQVIAGDRLCKLIGMVTNNRFLAVGMGTLVTSIIQSSSITTVRNPAARAAEQNRFSSVQGRRKPYQYP